MSEFVSSEQFEKITLKSLKALKVQAAKTGDANLFMIVNTNVPLIQKKDYIQRIIPIEHKIALFESKRVVIITQSNSQVNNYVELLRPLTTKYDNVELITIKKLKSFNKLKLKTFYNDYDIVIADYRVQELLPKILGAQFYLKNRKIPYIIKLSNRNTVDSRSPKDEIDIKFIKAQIKSIIQNVSFLLSTDSNITIKIYNFDSVNPLKLKEIYSNICTIIKFLTNKENKPITNWNEKKHQIKSIYLKTGESTSLPIYKAPLEEVGIEDLDD